MVLGLVAALGLVLFLLLAASGAQPQRRTGATEWVEQLRWELEER
jgi:hypothetical protein